MVQDGTRKWQLSHRGYGLDPCYSLGVQCSSAISHNDHRRHHHHHQQQQILVSSKPKPPSPPCQVVIGFCLVAENKHGDACESPRSVLEPNALCGGSGGMAKVASQEKHARSPRSALEGLLFGSHSPWDKKGVGLGIVAAIKAGEEEGEEPTKGHGAAVGPFVGKLLSPSVQQSPPVRSQPIPIAQPGPWPWKQKNQNKNQNGEQQQEAAAEDDEEDCEEEENRTALPWSNQFIGTGEHVPSPLPVVRAQKEARQSIFSTESPVSSFHSEGLHLAEVDFLHACFFCKRVLVQGKDIYMYRGDRAFCSPECRYRQIVLDEGKERGPVSANCYTGASSRCSSMLATPTSAAA